MDNKNTNCFDGYNETYLSNIKIEEFTLPYLSPIVLRKELENIITNKSGSQLDFESTSFINTSFIIDHSVIFWNLIWYFERIGVDNDHLKVNLLNSRLNLYNKKQTISEHPSEFEFKLDNFFQTSKNVSNNLNVNISCMWDNLKLHENYELHEIPLYLSYLNIVEKKQNAKLKVIQKFSSILTPNELNSIRKSNKNPKSLEIIIESIIRQIKESSDIASPIRTLLKERLCSKMNFKSIYREILFLIIVSLESELIDIDTFDTEYRCIYQNLLKSVNENVKDDIFISDRPPTNKAVCCRRIFSPLAMFRV